MKKRDALNEKLARLEEKLDKLENDYKAEREALFHEHGKLKEMVEFIDDFLSGVDEAFATLCVSHSTGGITSADLKTFAEEAELEIPDELSTPEEIGEENPAGQEGLSATG